MRDFKDLKIAVAGTGYVGLSIATLLSQHHKVMAVDIVPEKVELINNKKSPIQDLELSRRGGKVNIGKYGSTEVDFVTQKEGVLTYYQVTADMTAEETFERDETAAEHSG